MEKLAVGGARTLVQMSCDRGHSRMYSEHLEVRTATSVRSRRGRARLSAWSALASLKLQSVAHIGPLTFLSVAPTLPVVSLGSVIRWRKGGRKDTSSLKALATARLFRQSRLWMRCVVKT
eukprot:2008544-Amphidinium_carterae.1